MVVCAACGRKNPSDSRFCNGCGAALDAAPQPRREERKVVTVLFADLVGFTSRAERLDPEDVRALLDPYWRHLREELEHFGGTVEKFIGDAVMALFGAPVAHEDDGERAVRAALAIRDWVRETGEQLQVRIAVNTGEALVRIGTRPSEGEGMAAGDVVNTAARLQSAAPVNGVLVGESTYRATRHAINYRAAAPVTAKGKGAAITVWEAVSARSLATVEATSPGPLVGRAHELELLAGALHRARRDRCAQLVTVSGVPGIGKSRLVAELYGVVHADDEIIRWRRGRCLPYGDGVSLWALGEIVKAELGVLESDDAAETERKLRAALNDLIADETDRDWIARRLAPLAGLEGEPAERADSFAAWRRWLEALAEHRPLVLVVEDLHWADEELLDFVDSLVDRLAGVAFLVVCTTRPELYERRPDWGGGKRNALSVSLGPLDDADTARIVARALDQARLPAETQSAVLARADGNPLYAEQYARMVAEGAPVTALPETVQGIVAARLDLLAPEEKELLQDAAVSGRTFWPGALGIVSADDKRLFALVRKEFVRRELHSSIAGEQQYSFAHALVQDVAYSQIPRAARSEMHSRAAEWITTLPPDRARDRAALLAHHYGAAVELGRAAGIDVSELVGPARDAFAEAGDRAEALGSLPAAHSFYSAALELASNDDVERARLYLRRSQAALNVGGEALADAERAVALFAAAGDDEGAAEAELAAARASWSWVRGDAVAAARHADRALALTAAGGATRVRAEAVVERARLLMLSGESDRAITMATEGLALGEQLGAVRLQASALVTRGSAGRGELAAEDLRRGIEISERSKSLFEYFRGLNNLAEHYVEQGEQREVEAMYARIRSEARELGLALQLHWVDGQDVRLQYELGNWDRALELGVALLGRDGGGSADYLSPTVRAVMASVLDARGVQAAADEMAEAIEGARRVADPQVLAPTLARATRLLARHGRRAEARSLLDEVAFLCRSATDTYPWQPEFVLAFAALDSHEEHRAVLGGEPPGVGLDAAIAICDRDYARAIELYAQMDSATQAAETTVLAAVEGVVSGPELVRAIDFFHSVGATVRVREAAALLHASA
jgi:class 3 adenylate cyclase/tetratricopeptide (TPR) repeat protein